MPNTQATSRATLFSKVCMLLTGTLIVSAIGTWLGAGITGLGPIIVLAILFIAGAFAVPFAAAKSTTVGLAVLFGWTFISGLFLGPTINAYVHQLGWQTVFLAYLGTAGVMSGCGIVGAFSGRDFSGLGKWLTIALFGLIIVGIVNIFVAFSSGFTIIYSFIGMAVFAGFFLVDFHRLTKSENNDFNAIVITQAIYLDFINFLLFLLRFLREIKK